MIPKFRVWCTSRERMLNVASLFWKANKEENECLFANWWYTTKNSIVSSGDEVDGENFILMQSTGVYDENGVEIFEGDICCDEGEFGYDWWTYGFVKWDNEELRWVVDWVAEAIVEPLGGYSYRFGYGNIYENPELVEVEK